MNCVRSRFYEIQELEPIDSTYRVFCKTISGKEFTRRTIRQWFVTLVEEEDYSEKDRNRILSHLVNLSKTGAPYHVAAPRNFFSCMPEYTNWRRLVKERDIKCVWCGSESNLEVDHIKSMRSILKENDIVTREDARNCEALWDVNNGRVLCSKCHKDTETYGRG